MTASNKAIRMLIARARRLVFRMPVWTSPRTNAVYPVATTLVTGATQWQIKPLQDDPELDSRRSTGAVYWEGAVTISRDGAPAGRAYLEMTGYDKPMKL